MRSEVPRHVDVNRDVDDAVGCRSYVVHRQSREEVVVYVKRQHDQRDVDFVYPLSAERVVPDIREHDHAFGPDDIVYIVAYDTYRVEKGNECVWVAFYCDDGAEPREDGAYLNTLAGTTGVRT